MESEWQVSRLKILLIIITFLSVFFLILMTAYLRIELVYKRTNDGDDGHLLFSMFKGLVRYRLHIAKIDFKGLEEGVEIETHTDTDKERSRVTPHTIKKARHRYQEIVERVRHFRGTINWFLNKVICEKFSWSTSIGTGDAMETGIVVGTAWSLVSTIVGFFSRYIQWRHVPELEVVPDFQQMKLESKVHLIIRFRLGNAIRGIFRLLIQMRTKKEDQQWVNTLSKA